MHEKIFFFFCQEIYLYCQDLKKKKKRMDCCFLVQVTNFKFLPLKTNLRASLVAQWLRIHLPMQGTWVRALVGEDPTCRGATKPVCHNY